MRKLKLPPKPESGFKSPRELAEALNVSYEMAIGHLQAGTIHSIRVGKLWRIPAEEYARILTEGIQPTPEEAAA